MTVHSWDSLLVLLRVKIGCLRFRLAWFQESSCKSRLPSFQSSIMH
jgi:hypothetical protein